MLFEEESITKSPNKRRAEEPTTVPGVNEQNYSNGNIKKKIIKTEHNHQHQNDDRTKYVTDVCF